MWVIVKTVIITFAGTATTPEVLPVDRTDPVPVVPPKSTCAVVALWIYTRLWISLRFSVPGPFL